MKTGADSRKKTIIAGSLGAVALVCVIYLLVTQLGGSSDSTPAPQPVASAAKTEEAVPSSPTNAKAVQTGGGIGLGAIPGVDAQKLASTSSSLDPTLDEAAMLRTENLVYSGTGRNIFSLVSAPVTSVSDIPTVVPNPRPGPPPPPLPPPPPPTCPPSCPPIDLKFFGTAQRGNGARQAFLLQGEDVFLASVGDIVAHKYKIVSIEVNSIHVEDLSNNNTQTLPLQQ
jgi:hypothetical protein